MKATVLAAGIADDGGDPMAADQAFEFDADAIVMARTLFYNDGTVGPEGPKEEMFEYNRTPLLPGEGPGTYFNFTNVTRGINGLAIDVIGLPAGATLSSEDFEFRVGTGGDPSGWAAAPPPTSVNVRPLGDPQATSLVALIWPDGAIRNTWLRVMMRANENTQLAAPDVFYFGNLVGKTLDAVMPLRVNALDLARVRRGMTAWYSADFDFNRDGKVNALDLAAVRSNLGRRIGTITGDVPAAASFAPVPPPAAPKRDGATSLLSE